MFFRRCRLRLIHVLVAFQFTLIALLLYQQSASQPGSLAPQQHERERPSIGSSIQTITTSKESFDDREAFADTSRTLLFVVILTSPDKQGQERRQTIRNTWIKLFRHSEKYRSNGSSNEKLFDYRFFIGTLSLSQTDKQSLIEEQSHHGDLVQLPELSDSYNNLTLKVLQSFVWAASQRAGRFVLKCDDDSFVIVDPIVTELLQREAPDDQQQSSFYWGFFRGDAAVKRLGKWMEKKWFLCDRYLPYAHGGGYVVSLDLVNLIAHNAALLTLYNSEDVSVGVWLAPFTIDRRHDVRFNTEFVSRGCQDRYLVSHKQSVHDMQQMYGNLVEIGKMCQEQHQSVPSFDYAWHEVPSKCCKRSFAYI